MVLLLAAAPFIAIVVMFVAMLGFGLLAMAGTRSSACLNDVASVVRAFATLVAALRRPRARK